jgi:hypothetical protein
MAICYKSLRRHYRTPPLAFDRFQGGKMRSIGIRAALSLASAYLVLFGSPRVVAAAMDGCGEATFCNIEMCEDPVAMCHQLQDLPWYTCNILDAFCGAYCSGSSGLYCNSQ